MIIAAIFFQKLTWLWPVAIISALFIGALIWAYYQSATSRLTRAVCMAAKLAGFGLLVFCLLEPMSSKTRPREGANLMLLVSDNSQSLTITDADEDASRGESLKKTLTEKSNWQTRLEQDFDVRRFAFDSRMKRVPDFETLTFDGRGSSIGTTLETLKKRFQNRPVAGIMLFTDGNSTDQVTEGDGATPFSFDGLPPIYPVVIGKESIDSDLAISNVNVNQSHFEAAPVTVNADVRMYGNDAKPQTVVAELIDSSGTTIQRQSVEIVADGESKNLRFQFQPLNPGVDFYQLLVAGEEEFERVKLAHLESNTDSFSTNEPTLANNSRLVRVHRQQGPFRVLYVSGRPNWEYKYLKRAIDEDEEVDLIGIVRIAKKEPKFDFRSRAGESTNPLFRGFGEDGETSEQYDEPVIIRTGKLLHENELRDGFPKTAEELFGFQAVILDDIESEFFRQEQLQLLKLFVSRRGGGLMMLGGAESFQAGNWRRTPVADLLPVYLSGSNNLTGEGAGTADRFRVNPFGNIDENVQVADRFRFDLSRDGWLSPWIRLRKTEDEEKTRLNEMAKFLTVNEVGRIKPGAEILATVASPGGRKDPAIAVQNFGRGRSAAMSIGDFWRWGLERETTSPRDLEPAWRQTVRWLISDVPDRVQCVLESADDEVENVTTLKVTVLNEEYLPQDNAEVEIEVYRPDGSPTTLTAQASGNEPGVYRAAFASSETGGYLASVLAKGPDATKIGEAETGWIYEPAQTEFASMKPDRAFLQRLANATGGEVIESDGLDAFVNGINDREIPMMEKKISPIWHRWYYFVLAIGMLMAEWGVRRVKGLP